MKPYTKVKDCYHKEDHAWHEESIQFAECIAVIKHHI